MSQDAYFFPPASIEVVELVKVGCTRGAGDSLRNVTQVWTKSGILLAEHDEIHDDPVYASFFLRKSLERGDAELVKAA